MIRLRLTVKQRRDTQLDLALGFRHCWEPRYLFGFSWMIVWDLLPIWGYYYGDFEYYFKFFKHNRSSFTNASCFPICAYLLFVTWGSPESGGRYVSLNPSDCESCCQLKIKLFSIQKGHVAFLWFQMSWAFKPCVYVKVKPLNLFLFNEIMFMPGRYLILIMRKELFSWNMEYTLSRSMPCRSICFLICLFYSPMCLSLQDSSIPGKYNGRIKASKMTKPVVEHRNKSVLKASVWSNTFSPVLAQRLAL